MPACLSTIAAADPPPPRPVLRACVDPDDLPFSDRKLRGFENELARLVARELDADLEWTFWPQRRGFVRETLKADACDLVPGVPSSLDTLLVTRPYYRSSYVFVTTRARALRIASFDDPRLRELRIGVPLVGDDGANPPPVHALARRGLVRNVRGYPAITDRTGGESSKLVDALVGGEIDVAIAWGPVAGWAARRARVPLDLVAVAPQVELPFFPMVFDMAMGVRRGDEALRDRVDEILVRRRAEVDAILDRHGVFRLSR